MWCGVCRSLAAGVTKEKVRVLAWGMEPLSRTGLCVVERTSGLWLWDSVSTCGSTEVPWATRLSLSPLLSPELLYEDVFAVWEVIWAARHISSEHFVLFIALALVEAYREIIRDNNMDFTDIIKFFNGRHWSSHSGCPQWGTGASTAVLGRVGGAQKYRVPSL